MKLDSIEIEGFKSMRDVALSLGPMNVMIGANGAGKSNLVSAFGLLNQMIEERLQVAVTRAGGASSLLHFGPKRTQTIRLKLKFGVNGYEAKLGAAPGDTLFFEQEECWGLRKPHERAYEIPLGRGHRETKLPAEASSHARGVAGDVLAALRSWKAYHFHDTSPAAGVKQKGKLDDNAALRPDASNLAAFLFRLRDTENAAYRRIVAAIRQVAPFFEDFNLRPDALNSEMIQLEWSERGSDAYFNASGMSDGTLRFACLATLLLQPKLPSLVLIDEPELGLHPFAVAQLAAMLQSSSKKAQMLVATQSVTLMDHFEPDDVIVVDRADGQSTFKRIAADEVAAWAEEYSLGDLWVKNVIGGRPQAGSG